MTPVPPSLFRKTLTGAGVVVGTLLALEVVLRLWIATPSTTEPDPQFAYFQRPYSRQVFSSEGYCQTRVNGFGLNDNDPLPRKPPLRALLVGDSYTEAMQVEPSQNYGSVAESRVDGLEVCNAGRSGWGPPDLVAFARLRGGEFAPDVVVVQLNDRDLEEFFKTGNVHLKADGDSWEMVIPSIYSNNSMGHRIVRTLVHSSSLITQLRRRAEVLAKKERSRLERHFGVGPAKASPLPGKKTASLETPAGEQGAGAASPKEKAPRERPGEVDETGVPFCAVEMLLYLDGQLRQAYPQRLYLYIPHISYLEGIVDMPRRRAIYHEFARRAGVTLIDPTVELLAAYRRNSQPCHGFQNSIMGKGHLNARGHRIVGRMLAEELRKRLP